MYVCSICRSEVEVDHINPPVKKCKCNGTVIASIGAGLSGKGDMNVLMPNHNLSAESISMLTAMLTAIAAIEFFRDKKESIYLKDQIVIDQPTGRKFIFELSGKEQG